MLSLNNEANNPERLISFFSDESQGVVRLMKKELERESKIMLKRKQFSYGTFGARAFYYSKEGRKVQLEPEVLLC
jgi:hypothetical protein